MSPLHAGLCTALKRLLSAEASLLSPALCRNYSSTADPVELALPGATPPLAALHAATDRLTQRSAKTQEPERTSVRSTQLDYRHKKELAANSRPSGTPDQAVQAPQHRWGAPHMQPPRGGQNRPRQRPVELQQWRPDLAGREGFHRQEMGGAPRWQRGGPPSNGPPEPRSRPPFREDERGPRGAWSNEGPATGPRTEARYLPPPMRQSVNGPLQQSGVCPPVECSLARFPAVRRS